MRIALFHNTPSGGAKRAVYEWTQRLASSHEIDVYTLSTADHNYCDIRPFVKQHHVYEFSPRELFESPWGRLNQLQRWRDLNDLEQLGQKIAESIHAGGYDVVFAHACSYTFIPTCLSWLKIPTIYYLHEPFGRKFERTFNRPYLKNSGWREKADRMDPLIKLYQRRLSAIQLKGMRRTTRLLANSRFTQIHMNGAHKIKPPICHYGVNLEDFYPEPATGKKDFLLSVGELTPRKGFDFIIESLGHIPADYRPELKLACNVVNPVERTYIEGLASRYNVQLEILVSLSSAELNREYNQARLCVYAPVAEPFGLVPLEAMACGTAVVGVREGGVAESVVHEQTGLLVDRDPVQFAAAIQKLLCDADLAALYGLNGRQHVLENWTWEKSVAEIEQQLQEVAQEVTFE